MTEMLDTAQPNKAHYLSAVDTLRRGSYPAWLAQVRQAGAARFSETEFPTRRHEDWRFTNVAPIITTPFRPLTGPEDWNVSVSDLESVLFGTAGWTELVFINGYYSAALSRIGSLPKGVVAGSLADAISSGNKLAEHHLSVRRESGNVFNALNTALLQDGAFVHLHAGAVLMFPIHLVHVTTGLNEPVAANPRNLVVLGRDAQADIIESYVNIGAGAYFSNAVTDVALESGARVHWHTLVNESEEGYRLGSTRVNQDRNSAFRSFAITLGGKIVRNELTTVLDGEGAEATLNGLYLTGGEQLVDNAVAIEHAKPHCTSWIGYKGVLDNASSAVYSGKIKVRRNAQKTDSRQLNRNLLLSDRATVNTKPLLEIFADDVKCTHGATVGQHPKEVIFYFRSRGMNEAMARAMLTYGFADEVINQIDIEPLRRRLDRAVCERYSPI
ncbi:MAG: Fe-S cluster assembly protein SufD [Candidatus Hydrogenedentes bacterium]|nr:Fe-S cluster assembly protein SufD [Candidatus Hydrogenedentota bacterium]